MFISPSPTSRDIEAPGFTSPGRPGLLYSLHSTWHVVGGWESVRRGPFGKEESMGLLAGGRWGRQAQAPEPGLGSGGRPIAGGRGPGGAQVAVPRAQPWGELESKEPGSRWR